MKDLIVTTLPIKPQYETLVGMCIAPVISEIVGKTFNASNVISINLLHSYEDKDKNCAKYIDGIKNVGIKFDDIFIDKEHLTELKKIIYDLYENKYIVEMINKVYRCKCGKIDISANGIRDFNNGDLYYKKNNKIYCTSCASECAEYNEPGLYIYLDPKVNDYTSITPNFLKSDLNHFNKSFKGSYILISKSRKTNCTLETNNGIYNIDNDFIWMNYIQCFNEKNQILIASNHQLYEMYILNYINAMFYNKNLNFIATPYMKKPDFNIEENFDLNSDKYYKKLCLIYSLKWKNKSCNYDRSLFKFIKKLNVDNRRILFDYISQNIENITTIEEELNKLFMKDINIQNNINELKRKSLILKNK